MCAATTFLDAEQNQQHSLTTLVVTHDDCVSDLSAAFQNRAPLIPATTNTHSRPRWSHVATAQLGL
jgi:hypothetical protein